MIGSVVRFPRSVTEAIVDKGRARRLDRRADGESSAQRGGGDSRFFEASCDQTDRLVADGSHGHQEGQIDCLREEVGGQSRRQLVAHAARRIDAAHEGQRLRSELAERALLDELS